MDLGPSGHAGLDVMAEHVIVGAFRKLPVMRHGVALRASFSGVIAANPRGAFSVGADSFVAAGTMVVEAYVSTWFFFGIGISIGLTIGE